jgi:predicted nucleic acid-binding protein
VRVFLDTNVLISAFATRGLCAELFRSVIAEHELVLGEVVLATAHDAETDVLVTGDNDLLSVAGQARVRIVTPREFWEQLRKSR